MPRKLSSVFCRFEVSRLLMSGVLLFESIAQLQSKPFEYALSQEATNLITGEPNGEEYTNAPSSILGNSNGNNNQAAVSLRPFQLVLPREHLFGHWFGLRPKAEGVGIDPILTFVTDIAGNVTGGKSQGVSHADNLGLDLL